MTTSGSDFERDAATGAIPPDSHQADPARRRRLRWRARRGMLENDLLVTRFLDRHELTLTDEEVAGFDALMDLTDNELLDLFLGRGELQGEHDRPEIRHVLERLRAA